MIRRQNAVMENNMADAEVVEWVREKYQAVAGSLNERGRRLWAAGEARSLGWGGVAAVIAALGMSSATVAKGLRELKARESGGAELPAGQSRRPGGGRKRLRDKHRGLVAALRRLVEPTVRGDPMQPLLWICKSTSKLSAELRRLGFPIGPRTVAKELKAQEYSLQANRKTREGTSHPDRDAQFAHINDEVMRFQRRGQPAISVDTKKKELVGDFKNAGREWRPRGKPQKVQVHDFPDPKMKKAIPYGVYDLTRNEGWVSVGIDHDTARFAAASILRWWRKMGRRRYPRAKELFITADCGGSNSSRTRLWKVALQDLADATGLRLAVRRNRPRASLLRGSATVALAGLTLVLAVQEFPYHSSTTIPLAAARPLFVLGDSITAGIGAGERTWPLVLGDQTGLEIVNLARAGATVESAMAQARAVVDPQSTVIVEIGGNDLLGGTTSGEFRERLDRLLGILRARGGRTIAMFELPLPPLGNAFGAAQRGLAAKYNVRLIPKRCLASVLFSSDATLDGLHLSQEGHNRLATMVRDMLEQHFGEK